MLAPVSKCWCRSPPFRPSFGEDVFGSRIDRPSKWPFRICGEISSHSACKDAVHWLSAKSLLQLKRPYCTLARAACRPAEEDAASTYSQSHHSRLGASRTRSSQERNSPEADSRAWASVLFERYGPRHRPTACRLLLHILAGAKSNVTTTSGLVLNLMQQGTDI